MQPTLGFFTLLAVAVCIIGWCAAAWSQVQIRREIKPWVHNLTGRTRVDTFVMFRPDLLTPRGQEHRKRLLFGLSLFFAGILLGTLCHAFSTPPSPNNALQRTQAGGGGSSVSKP